MSTVRALRNAWGVRDYVLAAVKRDFVSRYLGTQLGWFWAIAQPLATIAIYTLVFAAIMRPSLPGHDSPHAYSIYLCAGLVSWQLFAELVNRGVGMFIANASLLKKVSLPKFALPAVIALSALSNFAVLLGLFVAFLVAVGAFPGVVVLACLPPLAILVAFALGLGVLLGTVNVFYRDVEQSTSLIISFWFWLTPIVYPVRTLPDWVAAILEWNPMWPLLRYVQAVFLEGVAPALSTLAYPAAVAAVFVVLGLRTFRTLAGELVDEL